MLFPALDLQTYYEQSQWFLDIARAGPVPASVDAASVRGTENKGAKDAEPHSAFQLNDSEA
jgi:hypothetical protein